MLETKRPNVVNLEGNMGNLGNVQDWPPESSYDASVHKNEILDNSVTVQNKMKLSTCFP